MENKWKSEAGAAAGCRAQRAISLLRLLLMLRFSGQTSRFGELVSTESGIVPFRANITSSSSIDKHFRQEEVKEREGQRESKANIAVKASEARAEEEKGGSEDEVKEARSKTMEKVHKDQKEHLEKVKAE